ncbi:TPA: glycosyltransferase family 4 protein, partial [Escherichia coli]
KDGFAIRFLEKVELFLYRRASAIISVTHAFKRELIARGVDGDKIDVILNGVDLDKYEPQAKKDIHFLKEYALERKFVAGYIGTHGMAQGLECIIDVAEILQEYDDIRIVFAGGGAERKKIVELVEKRKLKNIVLIERQPKEMMPKLWSLCDVSLVPLVNNELFKTVIPSKIFECMAMGIPTIMSVPEGEATSIIRDTNSGIIVESENPKQIAEAILKLYSNKELYQDVRVCGINAASNYSRDHLAADMIRTFKRVCS